MKRKACSGPNFLARYKCWTQNAPNQRRRVGPGYHRRLWAYFCVRRVRREDLDRSVGPVRQTEVPDGPCRLFRRRLPAPLSPEQIFFIHSSTSIASCFRQRVVPALRESISPFERTRRVSDTSSSVSRILMATACPWKMPSLWDMILCKWWITREAQKTTSPAAVSRSIESISKSRLTPWRWTARRSRNKVWPRRNRKRLRQRSGSPRCDLLLQNSKPAYAKIQQLPRHSWPKTNSLCRNLIPNNSKLAHRKAIMIQR